MRITGIHRQSSYFEVHTETAVYEIDGSLLREYRLAEGCDADEETLLALHDRSRTRRAYERACYLLDARDYSYAMLYRKLMQTYQDKPLCLRVMERLTASGMIDDRRYARKLAEFLVERKHYGLYRVRQELLRRGLDKSLIEEAVEDLDEDAEEHLPQVLAKKYGRILTDPGDFKTRQKVIAGMARQGYSFQSIKDAIEAYFRDFEEDSE